MYECRTGLASGSQAAPVEDDAAAAKGAAVLAVVEVAVANEVPRIVVAWWWWWCDSSDADAADGSATAYDAALNDSTARRLLSCRVSSLISV